MRNSIAKEFGAMRNSLANSTKYHTNVDSIKLVYEFHGSWVIGDLA
jgi:hypothetical protein